MGALGIGVAGHEPAPQVRPIAEPSQPPITRYFDLEANTAASMRALSRYLIR